MKIRIFLISFLLYNSTGAISQIVTDSSGMEMSGDTTLTFRKHHISLDGVGWYSTMSNYFVQEPVQYKEGKFYYKENNFIYCARLGYKYHLNSLFGVGVEYVLEHSEFRPHYIGSKNYINDTIYTMTNRIYEDFKLNTHVLNLKLEWVGSTLKKRIGYSNQLGVGVVLSTIAQKNYHFIENSFTYIDTSQYTPDVSQSSVSIDSGIDNRPLFERTHFWGLNLYYGFGVHLNLSEQWQLNLGVRTTFCLYEIGQFSNENETQFPEHILIESIQFSRFWAATSLNLGVTYKLGTVFQQRD